MIQHRQIFVFLIAMYISRKNKFLFPCIRKALYLSLASQLPFKRFCSLPFPLFWLCTIANFCTPNFSVLRFTPTYLSFLWTSSCGVFPTESVSHITHPNHYCIFCAFTKFVIFNNSCHFFGSLCFFYIQKPRDSVRKIKIFQFYWENIFSKLLQKYSCISYNFQLIKPNTFLLMCKNE